MSTIKTILIVDDSKADHVIVGFAIEYFDPTIQVLNAYDGQHALDILAEVATPPDLILLDINMPGMNGIEFLAEYAKYQTPSSVIAMLTSSDQYSDESTCMAYPFVKKYIIKPLDVSDLEEINTLMQASNP